MLWKAKPSYTVSIPQPCHENWQEMTAVEQGRFCKACQTVVTDFTVMSDDEIIKHFEKAAGGKMCGRFLNTQTDRALLPEIKLHRISAFRRMAASALLFYASLNIVRAQTPGPAISYVDDAKKPDEKATGIIIEGQVRHTTRYKNPGEEVIHEGYLREGLELRGLMGLELEIHGSDLTQITDNHGRFKFQLPDSCVHYEFTIGPTKNGQAHLDSLFEYMQPTKFQVNSLPFNKSVIINTQQNLCAEAVVVTAQRESSRDVVTTSGDIIILMETPIQPTVWQRIRHFFTRRWYRKHHPKKEK
jgi:hypothetical protein